ncbi:MAG: PfkB family carbohydrate kinase [Planctomycetota bacterium]|jgi:sugar/nucleoside kinase (ribokinase family)
MVPPPGFDVLGFGAVAVDDLLYGDEYPPAESKVQVLDRQRQCGGLTGTALVAAARLGAHCAYVGVLGRDELSRFVVDSLAREGVELGHCVERADARPAHSTIIVGRRRKTRTIFSSLDGALGADPLRPDEELIRAAGALLVDHHGLEGTIRATRIARQSGVGVVADLERDPGGPFAELLAAVDHLIISRRFARTLTGVEDPPRAAEELYGPTRRAVVVTCGAAGCWYVGEPFGRAARHQPAFPVEVVDTTGCGDVFHGAYAAALARGRDLGQRVVLASAAAALKATKPGGQAGCPTVEAVEDFLRDRGCGS